MYINSKALIKSSNPASPFFIHLTVFKEKLDINKSADLTFAKQTFYCMLYSLCTFENCNKLCFI